MSPLPLTLIVPYYCNPRMLEHQASAWEGYPGNVQVIVVDDGSPEYPAHEVLPPTARARVYQIEVDIPWNRNGARNLGAHVCETQWMLHTDVDHVLPPASARAWCHSLAATVGPWARLARYRVGRADETRAKDEIPPDQSFGRIKPHVDSFVIRRDVFWHVGGYDEDFSGSIGGSSLFLSRLERQFGRPPILEDMPLYVYTRDVVPDASDTRLSRDRSRYEAIRERKRQQGDPPPSSHLRFPWRRMR